MFEAADQLTIFLEEFSLYGTALVLVLLGLLVLLLRRQPKSVIAYSTDNGRVMVSRSAIIELVQTSCEQLKDVSKPQVRIRVKGKTTHFEVRLKLASGGHLRTIESTLQKHLRDALTENLGIENLGRINIVATGFKSGRLEQSSSIPKKEKEKEAALIEDPSIEDPSIEDHSLEDLKDKPTEDNKTL